MLDADAKKEYLKLLTSEYGSPKQRKRDWSPNTFPKSELPQYLLKDPFLWKIFKAVHYEDRNILMIVVGETGIGKSDFAVNIARKLDIVPLGNGEVKTNFIVECDKRGRPTQDTRVVFSASDFMRLVREGIPKGSAIVWDEAGVDNDNTKWYEKKSKLIKYIMQTFRKNNLILIMTVPDEESVTLATRRLVHVISDVYERKLNCASVDIRWLQRNRRNKETYRKHTAYYDEFTGTNAKLSVYLIEPLETEVRKKYDKIKDYILDDLYSFIESEMHEMDEIEKVLPDAEEETVLIKKFDVVRCMDIVEKNIKQVIDKKGLINVSKIILFLGKKGYNCSIPNARTIKANIEL